MNYFIILCLFASIITNSKSAICRNETGKCPTFLNSGCISSWCHTQCPDNCEYSPPVNWDKQDSKYCISLTQSKLQELKCYSYETCCLTNKFVWLNCPFNLYDKNTDNKIHSSPNKYPPCTNCNEVCVNSGIVLRVPINILNTTTNIMCKYKSLDVCV